VLEIPHVRLILSSRAENVLVVRQVLAGLADAIDLDAVELNDIATAVTEACNNVVIHAYDGEVGPLEVEIKLSASAVTVLVRDFGSGIRPRLRPVESATGGIGLPVIRALSHAADFIDLTSEGGTEVRMEFATLTANTIAVKHSPTEPPPLPAVSHPELQETVGATIAPPSLAQSVLPRLLSTLAARVHFSTDRISDAQAIADALAAHASAALAGEHLSVLVGIAPRTLIVHAGPLGGESEASVLHEIVDGLGGTMERLYDGLQVASSDPQSEILALQMADER
jgi:serine/threonine-protein kinase RsbW